ncbi:Ankyrin [Thioalkalivibrio nitratireducens DSM 14787]|uniref:Ankyrin n=1 Tax=Thioalkalivibrio nitratireducens (strain DSM 14787 / UNIQEM 213 / ALEN2) TaxID=1255043 RepID=L0DZ43_THIND|nr:ankyrin repeat domain-containing protein [Thioalkalivibrio nitratireducens]AGA33641.1 Ankyrin [Thioalkalivibrio nitratireducens DSM 14787]
MNTEHEREPCSKPWPALLAGCLIAAAFLALSPLDAATTAGGPAEPATISPEALTNPAGIALARAGEAPRLRTPMTEPPELARQRLLEMLGPNTPARGVRFHVLTVGQSPRDLVRAALGTPGTSSQTEAAWDQGAVLDLLFLSRLLAGFDEDGILQQLMLEPRVPLAVNELEAALALGPASGSRPHPTRQGELRSHRASGAVLGVDGEQVYAIWLFPDTRDAARAPPATRQVAEFPSAKARLIRAARDGDLDRLRDLVHLANHVTTVDAYGRTPLHHAAAHGHVAAVEFLLEQPSLPPWTEAREAPPTVLGEGLSAPRPALRFDDFVDLMRQLEARDGQGLTPLHLAATGGHEAVAKVLLDAGADINASTEDGVTPLHLAARHGAPALAATLIARGADTSAPDAAGRPPVDWARDDAMARSIRMATDTYRRQSGYQTAFETLERFLQGAQQGNIDAVRRTVAEFPDGILPLLEPDSGAFDYQIRRFHAVGGRARAQGFLELHDAPPNWDRFQFELLLEDWTGDDDWRVTDSRVEPTGEQP